MKKIWLLLTTAGVLAFVAFQNCSKGFQTVQYENLQNTPFSTAPVETETAPAPLPDDALAIYDSSLGKPQIVLVEFDQTDVKFSLNEINHPRISLVHKGKSCDFPKLQSQGSQTWPLECQWALQIFQAARKSYNFFSQLKLTLPPQIQVTTQDPDSRCIAFGGGDDITVCPASEDFMKNQMKHISAIIAHEMAHIVQLKKTEFLSGYHLAGLHEDHATLFSYLITGQTAFLDSPSGPQMRIHDPSIPFEWRSYGNYESHIALTTFLIDTHQALLVNTPPAQHQKVHQRIGQLYFDLLNPIQPKDTVQDVIKRYLTAYDQVLSEFEIQKRSSILQTLTDILFDRNQDLSLNEQSGYAVSLISQGLPADTTGTWRYQNTSSANMRNPVIRLSQLRQTPQLNSKLPLVVLILPKNYGELLNQCFQTEGAKQGNNTPTYCYRKVAGTSLTLQNGTVEGTSFEFKKPGDAFNIRFIPANNCSGTDFGLAKVFDSTGKDWLSFPVFFGCGSPP